MDGAGPLDAAAKFHAEVLPRIRAALNDGDSVVVRFDAAEEKPHRWRKEAIAALAREHAPRRVNAVAPLDGREDHDVAPTIALLHGNEALTGQLLIVD